MLVQFPGFIIFCGTICCVQITFSRSIPLSWSVAMEDHSQRMCRELNKRFPEFTGKQLELMLYLCLIAYGSEIFDGVCEDAWLRTIIKLKNHPPEEDREDEEFQVMTGTSNVPVPCRVCWNWLQEHEYSIAISKIEIRSNILPCKAYLKRLREIQESNVSGDKSIVLDAEDDHCCISKRELYPITSINQARLEARIRNGRKCDLTIHLRPNSVQQTERVPQIDPSNLLPLRKIDRDGVVSMENGKLGRGSSAKVYKVTWHKGTYALKSYKHGWSFTANEREYIESKILHPHIVHCFGYYQEDEKYRLLMELLDNNLTRYGVEAVRADSPLVKPLSSCAEDIFDVLLQIASAMEHLHLKEVVHGDLKSDNILLDFFEVLGSGRHFLAKVTDFGDSKVIEPGVAFRPAGDGTNKYAAPELLDWRKNREGIRLDHPKKIDVYAFGVVAYMILTGYEVYQDINDAFKTELVISGTMKPSGCKSWRILKWSMRFKIWWVLGLKERLPDELMELVERCWEFHPADRPDFSEICAELEKFKSPKQSKDHGADDWSKFIAVMFLLSFIICFLASLIKVVLNL
ncbi:hypothetical protein M758_12G184300 [Ceratodon purpureus]|nr:hypothetical protein M758_12G184300 [Ceratodon purpureus]